MTPQELKIVKESQGNSRVRKSNNVRISCPFHDCSEYSEEVNICELCHKWMETKYELRERPYDLMEHPCDQLSREEVMKRYWRSAIYDTRRS